MDRLALEITVWLLLVATIDCNPCASPSPSVMPVRVTVCVPEFLGTEIVLGVTGLIVGGELGGATGLRATPRKAMFAAAVAIEVGVAVKGWLKPDGSTTLTSSPPPDAVVPT